MVRLVLEKGADVNAEGGEWGNALQAASWEGYEEVDKYWRLAWCLDRRFEDSNRASNSAIRLRLNTDRTKFQYCSRLDCCWKGAEVNVPGGWFDNALEAASRNKHHGVVALLLENGARS